MIGIPRPPFYQLIYEYGFPKYRRQRKLLVKVKEDSLDFYITKLPLWYEKISIPREAIKEVSLDSETYRSAGKAAVGAIAAGVVTGGLGFIAGAAIGGRRRKANTLQLAVEHEGKMCVLGIKPNKQSPRLYSEIKHLIS